MPADPATAHWAKPPTRAGLLPVHIFTVTRPAMIDGKHVKDPGTTFQVLIPGCYCDGPAARALLKRHLPDGYEIAPIIDWRGDLSCVDHQRHGIDDYAAHNQQAA